MFRRWWRNKKLKFLNRMSCMPMANDIYAIKLKNGKYTYVHIPDDDKLAFDCAIGLHNICSVGNNKVTIDEEKIDGHLKKKDKDWIDDV